MGSRIGTLGIDRSCIQEGYTQTDCEKEALSLVQILNLELSVVSMRTEVSDHDMPNIKALCSQVISLSEYRAQLFDYLWSRMNAIAPNLIVLVGKLVGARLIAHTGSSLNLSKQPASTVQILGVERVLFRALKNKHQTPKYGLIFHASFDRILFGY